jgi:hypothetical protein
MKRMTNCSASTTSPYPPASVTWCCATALLVRLTPSPGTFLFFPPDLASLGRDQSPGLRLSIGMNFGPLE